MNGLMGVRVSHPQALHAALVLTGVMRQLVTELEVLAADIDSEVIHGHVHAMRLATDELGDKLIRERQRS